MYARRKEQAQVFFNQVAGRFDRVYGPGRSWQAFGHLLLRMLPAITVADAGEMFTLTTVPPGDGGLPFLLPLPAQPEMNVNAAAHTRSPSVRTGPMQSSI